MKNLMNYKVMVVGTMLAVLFASCSDDEVAPELIGDVYYISKVIEQDTVYALGFQAASNIEMNSVNVNSNSTDVSLKMANSTYFYHEPDTSEYSIEIPAPESFNFTGQFSNGETLTTTDMLLDDFLYPLQIDSMSTQDEGSLFMGWSGADGAGYYQIRLFDSNRDVVYESLLLSSSIVNYTINVNDDGWINGYYPATDEIFTFEIIAYLFDPVDDNGKYQSLSITEMTVVWQD